MSDSGSGSVPEGSTPFGSRYLLLEPLGSGSMGRVYRGQTRDTGEQVAIKVLRDDLASQPDIVARFIQERQVLRAVNHPNVVGVRDLVVEGEQLGIIMDLVPGGDLRTAVRTPLPADQALAIICEIADGLAAVHAANVVHRDLKPENVLADRWPDGTLRPRLTDFGVSRLISQSMTKVTSLIGTPGYLAPESVAGRQTESPADIYALGVMLYEMTCNRPPFVADNVLALIRAHAQDDVPRPTAMPDNLWSLLHSMLAKEPAQRPTATQIAATARQLAPTLTNTGPYTVVAGSLSDAAADATLIRPRDTLITPDPTLVRPRIDLTNPDATLIRPAATSDTLMRPVTRDDLAAFATTPTPPTQGRKTKRTALIIGASVLVTAAAATGIVLATSNGGTNKPAANANTPATNTATTVRSAGSPSNNTTATTQPSANTSPSSTSAPATSAQSQASDGFSDLIRPVVVSRSAAELNIAMPSIAVGPGGSVLVGSTKGTSWVWNQGSEGDWRELDNAASHDAKLSFIWSSAISPNGRYALTGSADGQINMWDLANQTISGNIERWFVGNSVRSITYSANGEDWAAVTNKGEIYTGRGREFNQGCGDCAGIATLEQGLISAAFTADNQYLAVGGKNGLARLVSTAGQEVGYFDVPGNDVWVQGVAVDPTGRYLALATGPENEKTRRPGWVAIYDLTSGSGAPFSTTTAHAMSALSIDFSPDGKYVATGSVDGTVVLWGWQSGDWVKALTLDMRSLSGGRDCRVGEAKFTLDGTGIAATCLTPSGAGFAVVWKIRN